MSSPAPDALSALLLRLGAGPGRLRAWSLVITVFGDAVAPRGGVLRLAALQDVVGHLGVEPGALRTAMSRLARDGWLERERRGRASFYALTAAKREELQAATRRIYAAGPPDWAGAWRLAALGPEADAAPLRAAGFAEAAPGLMLRPETAQAPPAPRPAGVSLFETPPGAAALDPDLLRRAWPEAVARPRLAEAAAAVEALSPWAAAQPAPLDALAARALLLHLWRRAALASAELPQALRPADWPGETARQAVRRLYWRLAPASERWLDACDGGPEGALPPLDPAFAARFGGPPPDEETTP
ncbi:MAG: PaaX family transcriptional regulator C-terminal domain-containing protein [Pseudomonadota bacterium]